MDCFIVIKRNDAFQFILGNSTSSTSYFGVVASGSTAATSSESGTPTYAVNGVAVPGGTGATRDQLHLAMPVGQWLIVEVRNLSLSTWDSFQLGNYGSYLLNGSIGSIVLCPAQSDASRTQIRTALAAEVGVTL